MGAVVSGKVAIVVSAPGNTTDLLIDAADLAASGNIDGANLRIDTIGDQAAANFLAVAGASSTNKSKSKSWGKGKQKKKKKMMMIMKKKKKNKNKKKNVNSSGESES